MTALPVSLPPSLMPDENKDELYDNKGTCMG